MLTTVSHLRSVSERAASGRVHDQQRLSDLIGVLYDAAIDPVLWECAIERAAYFVGGTGAALFCKDVGAENAVGPA